MKAALVSARDMAVLWTLKVDEELGVVAVNESRRTGWSLGSNMGVRS